MIEKAQTIKTADIYIIIIIKFIIPVGETELAPIAANVTRFCMFTELTTIEKQKKKTIYN